MMIVDEGHHNNINYWITKTDTSLQQWYCAYIEPPRDVAKDEWERIGFEPHGGITYADIHSDIGTYVWGWDYRHLEDLEDDNTKLAKLGTEKAVAVVREDVKEYVEKLLDHIHGKEIRN